MAQSETIEFVNVVEQSGICFEHSHGGAGRGFIVEGMSAGIATLDYNRDGLTDIYFLNGAPLEGTEKPESSPTNRLYENLGGMKFRDVTQQAGVGDIGYSLGVGIADYDGNGYEDIYVNNFGPNVFYRNRGDNTFEEASVATGTVNGNKVGAGVGFADFDGDGDLDLYVANYVDFSYENHVPITIKGMHFQAGPQYYKSVPDTLFRNEGNGQFSDISEASGISALANAGMGLVCFDADSDGDCDVYVCNDGEANHLWLNNGQAHFQEDALLSGVGFSADGKANASMGVDVGDYDSDGLLDLFVTAYQAEMPQLYRNMDGLFSDVTSQASIPRLLYPHVHWGTAFVDIDNDSDSDLFVACGHFDRIEQIDDRTSQKTANVLLQNTKGIFQDISQKSGPALAELESTRAIAFEDFDNDGDLDAVLVNSGTTPSLLRNDSKNRNRWIQIDLKQEGANGGAIGAVVRVTGSELLRPVVSGRGYQSHFGSRLHFGLGEFQGETIEIEVTWPDGAVTKHELPIDKISTVPR
ncbi:CRTAC1 family protein [Aureliella helgolandensis]|nr:CRTAC1 family protein [Aureliella helgolandensis]